MLVCVLFLAVLRCTKFQCQHNEGRERAFHKMHLQDTIFLNNMTCLSIRPWQNTRIHRMNKKHEIILTATCLPGCYQAWRLYLHNDTDIPMLPLFNWV